MIGIYMFFHSEFTAAELDTRLTLRENYGVIWLFPATIGLNP